ncbi:MAG: type II CAAX endopeptidase family protein [Planctomycetota bacterium]
MQEPEPYSSPVSSGAPDDSNDLPDKTPHRVGGLSIGGLVSWIVILLLTALLVGSIAIQQFFAVNEIGGDATSGDLMQVQLQARTVVGQNNLSEIVPGGGNQKTPVPKELNGGCYEQRLCFVTLKGETDDAAAALSVLDDLDQKVEEHDLELTENQTRLRSLLGQLYQQYSIGDFDSQFLSDEDSEFLKERLGFCGQLALLPDGTPLEAQRDELVVGAATKLLIMAVAGLFGILIFLAGFVFAVVYLYLLASGKFQARLEPSLTDHNVYIETFAIWLVIFFGSSLVMGGFVTDAKLQMLLQPIIFFGSLFCLVWPVVRGVSFSQVRRDIGWTLSDPFMDLVTTPFTYVASLPLLVPGFIIVILAAALLGLVQESHEFARQATPGHPIQEYISSGNVLMITLVFITACVAAPVVEETMFRGVFYRHLRELSSRYARWFSVFLSACINGFIFAAIHPQGLIAIPVLMSLAFCFSLAREWRGSLVSPIAMHAIHNTLITCFSLLIL